MFGDDFHDYFRKKICKIQGNKPCEQCKQSNDEVVKCFDHIMEWYSKPCQLHFNVSLEWLEKLRPDVK